MIFLKKTIQTILATLLTTLLFSACEKFKGNVEVPAYLHVDRIEVGPQTQLAPSPETGFYTSVIDAAQLICYFEGDASETDLGVYQLPITAPVLYHGTIKYVKVVPVVKQNGMASTRIAYPFYQTLRFDNVKTVADSVTNLGKYNAEKNEWILTAHYYPLSQMNVLVEDYFEPTNFSTNFDSCLTWVRDSATAACTGKGFGMVTVPDSVTIQTFSITTNLFPKTGQYLYLEMDYQTDLDLYINLLGFRVSSDGSASSVSVMCLVPNTDWQKIYINLGRAWGQFNYNTPITIFFQAANSRKTGGTIRIDNVKVLTR
jgi:hypothetical protein